MYNSADVTWTLVAAFLVFFMQAGFALCEAGLTRAKNTGNILMKNMMDFCIGTPCYWLVGFGIMFAGSGALIGGFDPFIRGSYDFGTLPVWVYAVFQTVFCATAATIVSGSMAERTKFSAYCCYSAAISLIVYPISGHWIWGGGWLAQLGFHDFAGSCAIHMVGGISALIGAKLLGPRIGKFDKDKSGKIVKVNAFPGHNLPIGCLGVFILWLGWYGFNGAAATSVEQLGSIFVTTTIAPAIATFVCMVFTWLKYGKPDVSMCLNASLAGLVGITAGCDVMDATGAIIVGIVSGLLVCFGVWLLDHVLHIDDPVGAVAVHFFNGLWGIIAVGLFATPDAPLSSCTGLFYGGGFSLLGSQLLGLLCIAAWTAVLITITFLIIKHTIGLRASAEEEVIGLDATEHNLPSAYADFMPSAATVSMDTENASVAGVDLPEPQLIVKPSTGTAKMSKIVVICKQEKLAVLQSALNKIGVNGMTVTQVQGYGTQKGNSQYYRGVRVDGPKLLPKVKIEIVVTSIPVETIVDVCKKVLYTGQIGDGKIFVYDVEEVVKVRTGETGYDALQGDD